MDRQRSRREERAEAREAAPTFGEWMRRQRKILDLTQDELARRAGCAKITIRKLEAEDLKPSKELAQALAEILRVPAAEQAAFVQFARGGVPLANLAASTAGEEEKPWLGAASRSGNLPIQLTRFIGREREVAEVKRLLGGSRLVTLTGPGGCGKTRLALQVAVRWQSEFQHRVRFVDLAPLNDPELIPQTVATVLGVREEPHRPLLDSLTDYISGKHLLLVLDNCEHLIERCSQLGEALLRACANLKILATSREALAIGGETIFHVSSLTLPPATALESPTPDLEQYEAVQLFMDRVRAVQPGFRITDSNATAITQICIRLDGIPLAIELAAARTKLLTAEHIAERLDDRFNLLATGSRTSLPRQQTLRAAIDWSYDLLSAQERLLYRRVCVFVGGFALESVEAVCDGEGLAQEQVLDRLSQLIAKSMVVADTQHGREARYRLSETIRQYGLEKLRESREADTIQHRHLDFFLKFAEEAEPELRGDQQLIWLNKLEAENDNLRAALAWSRVSETTLEAGLRLAGALWRFWWLRAQLSEGREWLTGMLSRAALSRSSSRAKVLLGAGNLTYYQGDYTAARSAYEEGLTICHQTGDKPGAANSLNGLGNVAFSQGDYASAQRFYEESLAIRRELGDDWSVANSLCNLSGLAQSEGNYAAALLLLQECLSINRKLGDRRGIAFVLNNLGNVILAQSEQDRAHSLQDESLTLYLELGDKWGIAYALNSLGDCEHSQGNYDKAYLNYAASLKLLLALKDKNGLIRSLEGIAIIAAQTKQLERSVRLLGAAQSLRDQIGLIRTPAEQTQCNRNLADLRTQLDADVFGALWAEGSTMALEQASDYALAEPTILSGTSLGSSQPLSPSRAAQHEFGGLTAREREIAALIAQGKSNRSIAKELAMGVKTVEAHITRILAKLGLSSRTQIAVWAIGTELVPAPQDLGTQIRES